MGEEDVCTSCTFTPQCGKPEHNPCHRALAFCCELGIHVNWQLFEGWVLRGHFLISGPLCSLHVGAGAIAEPGSCPAEHRHIQLFPLSFSLYNFLKSCKTKGIQGDLLGEKDLKSSWF